MKTRLVTPALAALALGAALIAPMPPAFAAPVLTAVATPDANDPQLVPVAGPGADSEAIHVHVNSTEATTVTATPSGTGLSLGGPVSSPTSNGSAYFSIGVLATTPGTHTLTVTFSAPGATDAVVTYPYIIAEGSPLPTSTGSLAGRSYGWMGYEQASVESDGRAADMITFVNGSYAYLGLPPFGFPKCTSPGHGCYPYSYDASTGNFQVGTDVVGKLIGEALYTDGFVVPDSEDGEQFGSDTLQDPLVFPKRGTRLEGHWLYHSEDYPNGLVYEEVTLHKDGTYALSFTIYVHKAQRRHFTGSYKITGKGRITFLAKHKPVVLGSIAFPSKDGTKAKPKKDGLWLVLSGTKGKSGDGNLLPPVKKKH